MDNSLNKDFWQWYKLNTFFKTDLSNIYYVTQLYEINVKLSENQKKNLSNAYHKRETMVLRLTKDSLSGNDTVCTSEYS